MNWELLGTLIAGVGGWETIQFLLNKFYFDKRKNKNEENAGEIANLRGQFDIMRDLNTVLNETVGRLQQRLDTSEETQQELLNLLRKEDHDVRNSGH